MTTLITKMKNALKPSALARIEREKAEDEAREEELYRERRASGKTTATLIRKHVRPIFEAVAALPEKNGKKFTVSYGDDFGGLFGAEALVYKQGKTHLGSFGVGIAYRTTFGRVKFKYTKWDLEGMSKGALSREFAKWIQKIAPERVDEVRQALEKAAKAQPASIMSRSN